MSASDKVAIVEIATPDGAVATTLIEISLDGETLTISDQHDPITDEIRELARQLVDKVRQTYDSNTNR
ncbi:MAG: hypothetical protein ACYTEQ_06500 [Planctomycetota bacterium]|jgi:hypothetical protein